MAYDIPLWYSRSDSSKDVRVDQVDVGIRKAISLVQCQETKDFVLRGSGIRGGNRGGRAGLGRANSGSDQNQAGPKLTRFFRAKILTAQPVLKIGLVGPNSLFKAKKNSAGRAGPGHTWPGQI